MRGVGSSCTRRCRRRLASSSSAIGRAGPLRPASPRPRRRDGQRTQRGRRGAARDCGREPRAASSGCRPSPSRDAGEPRVAAALMAVHGADAVEVDSVSSVAGHAAGTVVGVHASRRGDGGASRSGAGLADAARRRLRAATLRVRVGRSCRQSRVPLSPPESARGYRHGLPAPRGPADAAPAASARAPYASRSGSTRGNGAPRPQCVPPPRQRASQRLVLGCADAARTRASAVAASAPLWVGVEDARP